MDEETKAGTALAEAPEAPAEQGTEAAKDDAAPVDYKSQWEAEKARADKAEQRAKSAEGRAKYSVSPDDLDEIKTAIRRLGYQQARTDLKTEDLPDVERSAKLKALDDGNVQETATRELAKYKAGMDDDLTELCLEDGVPIDHPQLRALLPRFKQANSTREVNRLFTEARRIVKEEVKARMKAEATAAKQAANRENNTLAAGAGNRGTPAGVAPSLAALTKRDLRNMTHKQILEHQKALTAAMSAQR